MQFLSRLSDLGHFYYAAKTLHDLHSPALFALVQAIFDPAHDHADFNKLESLRKQLVSNQSPLELETRGAPSGVQKNALRTFAEEASGSLLPSFQGKWLYRLVHLLQPKCMLEMGTSFGVSTLYQHLGAMTSEMVTIYGEPENAKIAAQNFSAWPEIAKIEQIIGQFEDVLPHLSQTFDYVFIDGDRRIGSLLLYMDLLQAKTSAGTVFVLRDIHGSQEMYSGWKQVLKLPYIRASIDLFHFGILLTDPGISEKEHLQVVPAWMKPWRLGIWG